MKRLLLPLILLMFSSFTYAQLPSVLNLSIFVDSADITWSWERPDTREDSSALPPSEIAMYTLWCSESEAAVASIPLTASAEYAARINGIVSATGFLMNQLNSDGIAVLSADRTSFEAAGVVPQLGGYYGCQIAVIDSAGISSIWSSHINTPKQQMPVRPTAPLLSQTSTSL